MTQFPILEPLSYKEYTDKYEEIMNVLCEPFPSGTVKKKNDSNKSAHIPVQAYIQRLNKAAGGFYSWTVTTEKPIYHLDQMKLEMRGKLQIMNTSNEGMGFQNFSYIKDSRKIHDFEGTVKAAVRRALVDALNTFEAGWKDLAQYREWGYLIENEGDEHGSEEQLTEGTNIPCKSCNRLLTNEELEQLQKISWQVMYCDDHVPDFVRKKILSLPK